MWRGLAADRQLLLQIHQCISPFLLLSRNKFSILKLQKKVRPRKELYKFARLGLCKRGHKSN